MHRPRLANNIRYASNPSVGVSNNGGMTAVSPLANMNGTSGNSVIPTGMDEEKPLASGNGVTVEVHLAEPVLFLQGFENQEAVPGNAVMLRGSLHVRVQKSAKIKAITLKFNGRAITKCSKRILPRKTDSGEINTIINHTRPFFNAQFDSVRRILAQITFHFPKVQTPA